MKTLRTLVPPAARAGGAGSRLGPRPWLPPLAAAWILAGPAAGQESGRRETDLPRPPTIFDLDYRVENPRDLLPPERNFQNRWRRIWGALGMRYHLYPSQQTGPDAWPPHPFSGGMNYSLWRNPVTGWPEF